MKGIAVLQTVIVLLLLSISTSVKGQYIITSIAGNGIAGILGDAGIATSAELNYPVDVAIDTKGNIYIADVGNNRIRKINSTTGIITTIAGTGVRGYTGDGGLAINAEIWPMYGVTVDTGDNVYIVDYNRIRKINSITGIITTIAGTGHAGYSGDGGLATAAELNFPTAARVDVSGNIYIADGYSCRIRKVNANNGIISTIAGTGVCGYSGDSGLATAAELGNLTAMTLDNLGNIYAGAPGSIRKVGVVTGIISTIAGNGNWGYSGDGGAATAATLRNPSGICINSAGNVYFAESERIRMVNASTGIITTVAGNGQFGYSGDGGIATAAELHAPAGLTADVTGHIYIADNSNSRIRKLTPSQNGIVPFATNKEAFDTYPNPFNEFATFTYNIPKSLIAAVLKVYDIRGSLIRTYVLNTQENALNISANDFENGIYLYGIEAVGFSTPKKKMVVVK